MNTHVYLASASPRRRELLDQISIAYTVIKPDVDESRLDDVDPQAYTQRIAVAKAFYVNQVVSEQQLTVHPIISADTAVVYDHQILGKPRNTGDAMSMLNLLSGNTHLVYSSICLLAEQNPQVITQVSKVTFKQLSKQEIKEYCDSGEPADKAGAYGIQGLGAKFVKHLNGSYSGVMGLPLYELTCLLENKPLYE